MIRRTDPVIPCSSLIKKKYPPRHPQDASALCIRHCLKYRHRIAEATQLQVLDNRRHHHPNEGLTYLSIGPGPSDR